MGKCVKFQKGVQMTTLTYSTIVGALNLWFLVLFLPNSNPYFSSITKGGYLHLGQVRGGSFFSFFAQNSGKISLLLWLASSVLTFSQTFTLASSLLSFFICHYYFIFHRYSGVGRGIGAPGYFITWANFTNSAYLLMDKLSPSDLNLLSTLMLIELGVIFLVSGIYKISAGYTSGRGINIGLNNPQWAYFPNLFNRLTSQNFMTKILNYISVYGEIVGGILLISVKFQIAGSIIIAIMFLGVALMVRLGNLCAIIVVTVLSPNFVVSSGVASSNLDGQQFVRIFIVFCSILSLANYIAININFYFRLRLPRYYQNFTNFFVRVCGTSMWRVFTADITSIYIEIYMISNNVKTNISSWSSWKPSRFRFVGEAIAVTSIFTLQKYTQDKSLFESRILNYVRTLKVPSNEIYFDYFFIEESGTQMTRRLISTYKVDRDLGLISEIRNDLLFDLSAGDIKSKLYKTDSYGNYS